MDIRSVVIGPDKQVPPDRGIDANWRGRPRPHRQRKRGNVLREHGEVTENCQACSGSPWSKKLPVLFRIQTAPNWRGG